MVIEPTLFVGDGYPIPDELLIGHKDSFLHKKIYLALTPGGVISTRLVP